MTTERKTVHFDAYIDGKFKKRTTINNRVVSFDKDGLAWVSDLGSKYGKKATENSDGSYTVNLRATSIKPSPPIDSRDPDHTREGIFVYHNCSRCKDGKDLSRCPTPKAPGNCGYPHARND